MSSPLSPDPGSQNLSPCQATHPVGCQGSAPSPVCLKPQGSPLCGFSLIPHIASGCSLRPPHSWSSATCKSTINIPLSLPAPPPVPPAAYWKKMETRFAAARAGMDVHRGVGPLLSMNDPPKIIHAQGWQASRAGPHLQTPGRLPSSGHTAMGGTLSLSPNRCPENTWTPYSKGPYLLSGQKETESERFRAGRMEFARLFRPKPSSDWEESEALA